MRKRRFGFVDRPIQMRLIGRVINYFLTAIVLSIFTWAACQAALTGNDFLACIRDSVVRFYPVFLVLLVILPIALLDIVRITNQFAGPVKRLQNQLKDFERGEKIKPLSIRESDLCADDLPNSINALIDKIDELESVVASELDGSA